METLTVMQIKEALDQGFKPVSKRQVFRYLKQAGVKPFGRMSRPRLYPKDSIGRLQIYLELPKLPSMNQLRDVKRRSAKARRHS